MAIVKRGLEKFRFTLILSLLAWGVPGHETPHQTGSGVYLGRKIPKFEDEVVIYQSKEDDCWIAHSLRMDQIGTGDSILNALADLLGACHSVIKVSEGDKSIAYLREAPKEVQEMARRAKKLPKEIYEVAHKKAHGEWPAYLNITSDEDGHQSYRVEIPETAC